MMQCMMSFLHKRLLAAEIVSDLFGEQHYKCLLTFLEETSALVTTNGWKLSWGVAKNKLYQDNRMSQLSLKRRQFVGQLKQQ